MFYAFGDCQLHPELFTLARGGQQIQLRPKVYRTLEFLIQHRNRIVSKDELCNEIWEGRFVSDTTIESTIKAVRRAVGDNGNLQRIIKTQSRRGYRFIATVDGTPESPQQPLFSPSPQLPATNNQTFNRNERIRRQITVMYCEMRLDETNTGADDMVQRLRDLSLPIVQYHQGHWSQSKQNGFWIYFSYPRAQEDAASRAVNTALEIIQTLQQQSPKLGLLSGDMPCLRIGIHTGPVLINAGTTEGEDDLISLEDTPNVAAKLANQARADSIAISKQTHHLIEGQFTCTELDPISVDNTGRSGHSDHRDQPKNSIHCYGVTKSSRVNSSLKLKSSSEMTPLQQRCVEISLLTQRWHQTRSGSGHVSLVSGEAGIGKSRLIREFYYSVKDTKCRYLISQSSPYYLNSPFYPIVELFQKSLGSHSGESIALRLKKLEQILSHSCLDLQLAIPLIAPLLCLPIPAEQYSIIQMSPQQQREKTIEILVTWLIAESRQQPLLLVWEDLHWADPSSLAFLNALIDHIPTAAIFLVMTYRVEFQQPFPARSYITSIVLNRLDSDQAAEMVRSLQKEKALTKEVTAHIVDRSDGIPLFIEEYTKMFLEKDCSNGQETRLTNRLEKGSIPETLQDVLVARFDRFNPGSTVAQIGAVFGREFSYEAVAQASSLDDTTLQAGLNQLVSAELLLQTNFPPQAHYKFKHSLIQEAAYQCLIGKDRKRYHRNIARCLETQYSNGKQKLADHFFPAEVIAHHFEMAGAIEPATRYWLEAGKRSAGRAAYLEAVNQLSRAYQLVMGQKESIQRDQFELAIIMQLGAAHAGAGGFSVEDTGAAFRRALELCSALGNPPETLLVLAGMTRFEFMRANFKLVDQIADQAISLANSNSDPTGHVVGNRMHGTVHFVKGQFDQSIASLQTSIEIAESVGTSFGGTSSAVTTGDSFDLNNTSAARSHLSVAKLILGQVDTALTIATKNVADTENLDPHSYNYALCYLASLLHLRDDGAGKIIEIATQCRDLALQEGYGNWLGTSRILRGEAVVRIGQLEEGLAEIEQGIADQRRIQALTFRPMNDSILAKGYLATYRAEEALALLIDAEALTIKTEQLWYLPELQRLRANTLIQLGEEQQAIACYMSAFRSAAKLGAKFWTLKIAMSFACSNLVNDQQDRAYQQLRSATLALDEGAGTPIFLTASEILSKFSDHSTATEKTGP